MADEELYGEEVGEGEEMGDVGEGEEMGEDLEQGVEVRSDWHPESFISARFRPCRCCRSWMRSSAS